MAVSGLLTLGLGFNLGTRAIVRLGFSPAASPPARPPAITSFSFGVTSMDKFIQSITAILVWAGLVKASTPWAGAEMGLFTNALDPSDRTVLADLTEATFDGYARAPITWGTPYIDGTGQVIFEGNNCEFLCTAGTGEILEGYFVIGAGDEFLGAVRFAGGPRAVTGVGTGLNEVAIAAF